MFRKGPRRTLFHGPQSDILDSIVHAPGGPMETGNFSEKILAYTTQKDSTVAERIDGFVSDAARHFGSRFNRFDIHWDHPTWGKDRWTDSVTVDLSVSDPAATESDVNAIAKRWGFTWLATEYGFSKCNSEYLH